MALLPSFHVIVWVNISPALRHPRVESAIPTAGRCLVNLANVKFLGSFICHAYPVPSSDFRDYDAMTWKWLVLKSKKKLCPALHAWSNTVAITYFVFCPSLCLNVNPENRCHSVFFFHYLSLRLILSSAFLITWQKGNCEEELPSAVAA